MKNILLPTDFSENAWNAIAYALQLLKEEECKFYVLNTYTPILYQTDYALLNPGQVELEDPVKESSVKNLKSLENRIKTEFPNPRHQFEFLPVFGSLISEMRDMVKSKNLDLIVMGTKGATGARGILFGSNTVHAFNSVKAPILAIPENFEFESPIEILFPTDYNVNYTEAHLNALNMIASRYHSRLNILHVFYGEELTERQEENKSKLEQYFKHLAPVFHHIDNQNIPQAIDNFQMKAMVNMLVMLNNKHSFFENLFFRPTIKQIGFHVNVPFLVIPTKA